MMAGGFGDHDGGAATAVQSGAQVPRQAAEEDKTGDTATTPGGLDSAETNGGPPAPTKRGPSTRGYWFAGALALAAVLVSVAIVATGVLRITSAIDDLQRVDVPGEGLVTFTEPGGYTVYYEGPGVGEDGGIPGFSAALVPEGGEEGIPLSDYVGSFTYSLGGHDGAALWTVRIERPGTYRLVAFDETAPGGTLAVGPSVGGGFIGSILAAMAVGLLGLVLAAAVAIATLKRRRRFGRQTMLGTL